jgi:hypothetical protein
MSAVGARPGGLGPVELGPVEQLLVLRGPSVAPRDVAAVCAHPRCTDHALAEVAGDDRRDEVADGVLLVVRDRLELRLVVGAAQNLPASRRLVCVLLEGTAPPLVSGSPSWPAVDSLTCTSAPVCSVSLAVASPLLAGDFVADLARGCAPGHLRSDGRPTMAFDSEAPHLWAPGDAMSLVGTGEIVHDVEGDYPADLVVTVEGPATGSAPRSSLDHPVVGRLPDAVQLPRPPSWSDYGGQEADVSDEGLALHDGLGLGPVDCRLVNPQGFLRRVGTPAGTLTGLPDQPHLCRLDTKDGPVVLDTRHGLRDTDVARLRPLLGVHVSWRGGTGPVDYCRLVVALAAAGVPLTCDPAPGWAVALVHPSLLEAMTCAVDLLDPMDREVHSIRTRRAAYAQHSAPAWRRRVAELAGAGRPRPARVSVLLPTRRPEHLAFALRQVARQRGGGAGVDLQLELVLATHGHDPDRRVLDAARELADLSVTTLTVPGDEPLGALLNLAAERAGGDLLLKMDDDDWYGPDFVTDLLMAREHSGADITGAMAEFVYVEPLDLTVRRRDATESYRPIVAGGTMMLARDALASVGGFRPMRRHVDAGLLSAVRAAGGSVYRTHGHGYLLRRGSTGHTWDPGLPYFVSRSRTSQQWRGFRPSVLLEADDEDRPAAGAQRPA